MTGSGTGKKAFLENNSALFSTTGTVHFAGSDSVLSSTELSNYTTNFNQPTNANRYGALIQVPSVATSVTIPFNKAGSAVDLSVAQICGVFSCDQRLVDHRCQPQWPDPGGVPCGKQRYQRNVQPLPDRGLCR